jgi:endonuclease/exonuclease/phosphatase family metal-dependent hydrolase
MKQIYPVLIAILTVFSLHAQDRVKVMSYNLLNYGNVTSYCTTSNNNMSAKNGYIATIVDYVQPDILAVVEMGSADFAHQRLLDSALNVNGGIQYVKAQKVNTAGSSILSLVYYNSQKFGLAASVSLQSTVRDVVLFRLYYKSPNLAITKDTAFINCIVAHLKAGNTTSSKTTRTQMVNQALGYLSAHYPADNYLFMGDLNLYSSNEGAYQALLNYSNTAYRFYDPINTPGSWNNNSGYAAVHTQSTHSSSNGCASGGGLDDRFDFILISDAIKSNTKHISYVSNSYKAIGNDGKHFNKSINSGTNNSVPANVLNALYNNSDHLPVVLELDLDNTIAGLSDVEKESGLRVYFENPVQESVLNLYVNSKQQQNVRVELYDISGRLMAQKQTCIGGNSTISFDLSAMAAGLYFVRIRDEKQKLLYSAKMVK